MKKKSSKRSLLWSRLFIVLGLLCIVIGLGYEAINYPWMSAFGAIPEASTMKEPAPLEVKYFSYHGGDPSAEALTALPASNQNLPLQRPEMKLTLMGSIKIPKIGISENIVQGVGDEILYAVGHDPDSSEPGKPGNCVLAGHRNYIYVHPFKHLPKMEEGDIVQIEMAENTVRYEVFQVFTVAPEDVWVTQPQPDVESMLTLITCTPVPAYSQRLIVWAKLIED